MLLTYLKIAMLGTIFHQANYDLLAGLSIQRSVAFDLTVDDDDCSTSSSTSSKSEEELQEETAPDEKTEVRPKLYRVV